MQIRLTCQCGRVIQVDGSEGDSTILCPACGCVLSVAEGAAVLDEPASSPSPTPIPPVSPSPSAAPSAAEPAVPPQASPPQPAQPPPPTWPGMAPEPPPPPPRTRNAGLGVAGMVVGILSCIPCCFCGVSGLVLGVAAIGLSLAPVMGKTGGRGFGIAGLILGCVGLLFGLAMAGFWGVGVLGSKGASLLFKPPPVAVKSTPVPALPAVLTGPDVTAALTGPLVRGPDSLRAAEQLRQAVAAFPGRQDRPGGLFKCVQAFRLHLAFAQRTQPQDPEHARMFRTAGQELADQVLEQYRKAGDLEHDGQWAAAQTAYDEVLGLVPDGSNEVALNVRQHQHYCRQQAAAKADSAPPRPGQPAPPKYEAEPGRSGGRAGNKDF